MWVLIGSVEYLRTTKCRRLYAETGKEDDLSLFFHKDKFYALNAWCGHLGGPLFQGEIEDVPDSCRVICPWHGYTFDLQTGKCPLGITQPSYPVKIEEENVYVEYDCNLLTYPHHQK